MAIEVKIPEGDKRSEYMQVMCDLNVLAFQTDTTRVSTYIGSTPNGASYPELGFNDQHHSQTHHNNQREKVRKVAAITAFNIAQFAHMVRKMHNLREGDGTLLDPVVEEREHLAAQCTPLRSSRLEWQSGHRPTVPRRRSARFAGRHSRSRRWRT